ncbi:MAG: prepilin-type N-terminal cleavage/methylation domain-containing protein [Nitrosospira sp.]
MGKAGADGKARKIPLKNRRHAGFTLIELLVVMAIIATLLSIVAPRYFNSLDRSKETVLRQNLGVMRDAIDKFYSDTGDYPEELAELVEKRYLRSVPVDPLTESAATWIVVPPPGGAEGIYDVHSGSPGEAKDGTSYETW